MQSESSRQVYLLNPKVLSPETIAVAFAKTSRSPKSFNEIANELSDDRSADFHEKWVIGYGHASVAEHAVLHIAIENISRLAIESLEGNQLASYTEKSTRYQQWDPESFFIPKELDQNTQLQSEYVTTCRMLFNTYQQSIPAVKKVIQEHFPRTNDESIQAWDRRTRSDYVDVCRFLLPACSLANVGTTINARSLEHALQKMLSHPLEEVRSLGIEIKKVALHEVPTLVKYANVVPYLESIQSNLPQYLSTLSLPVRFDMSCKLIDFDTDIENKILSAALYRFGNLSYTQCLEHILHLSDQDKKQLAILLFTNFGPHDSPIRELEYSSFLFDLVLDQGAYFELKRHRMMTQTPQVLGTDLGFAIPQKMIQASFHHQYTTAMEKAVETFNQLREFNPEVASYVVPNGFNRRVLVALNLRSAFHLINLRSAPNAHFSIRRIALMVFEEIKKAAPLLAEYINTCSEENWQQIETQHFDRLS